MDHPLHRLITVIRNRLPVWIGGLGGSAAAATETDWPLADALQCNGELGRSFALDPLPVGDKRFVARADDLEAMGTIIERWQRGHPVMVAVTGPQGCGITSFLNQVPSLLDADTICHSEPLNERLRSPPDVLAMMARLFNLQTVPDSVAALIDELNAAAPRVLLLDNAHFLVFRVMGARDAARTLGTLMVATQRRHLWIMGCRRQAWRRMMYLHQVERFFTDVLELEYFSTGQLGDVIAARQAATSTDEVPDHKLQRLQLLCRGKPDLGFLYLQCGEASESGDIRPLDLSVFKQLEMDDLFTLAELAVHGSLHLDEYCQIFRLSIENSQLRLQHLCNQGLVERLGPDGSNPAVRYRVTPVLSGLVSDHLYKSNYLY